MKGDFSRIPHDPTASLTRILFQQGKPLVEADINEALSAVLANQRKIIRLLRRDLTKQLEGAFGDAFLIRKHLDRLQIEHGDYRFDDTLVTNRRRCVATGFRPNRPSQDTRYVASFDGRGAKAPKGWYLVILAATERPMILGEIEERAPELATFRTAIPCILDWAIVLEPVLGPAPHPDTLKQDVEARFPLDLPDPVTLVIAWKDAAAAKTRLPQELHHRLWRLEIHRKSEDGLTVDLKFALDNASETYGIAEKSFGKSAQLIPNQVPARDSQPLFEIERADSWLDKPEDLLRLDSTGAGVLANSAVVADEAKRKHPLQARRWDFYISGVPVSALVAEDGYEVNLPTIQGHPFSPITIKFSEAVEARRENRRQSEQLKSENKLTPEEVKRLATELDAELQKITKDLPGLLHQRDAWTFRTTQIFQQRKIPGLRQPVYYTALGTAEFDDTGKLVNVDRESYRQTLKISEVNLARAEPRPAIPVSSPAPLQITGSIACRSAFPLVQSLAAKRWLASVTFGEIAGLTKEQLRRRIERDSQPKELDPPLLERDLNEIVARRQQLLSLETIA